MQECVLQMDPLDAFDDAKCLKCQLAATHLFTIHHKAGNGWSDFTGGSYNDRKCRNTFEVLMAECN